MVHTWDLCHSPCFYNLLCMGLMVLFVFLNVWCMGFIDFYPICFSIPWVLCIFLFALFMDSLPLLLYNLWVVLLQITIIIIIRCSVNGWLRAHWSTKLQGGGGGIYHRQHRPASCLGKSPVPETYKALTPKLTLKNW